MALMSNMPTFTYVKWTNMIISFHDNKYTIQNNYTNKTYIYWSVDSPYQLFCTNEKQKTTGSLFLIAINEKGIATQVPHDDIVISYDGENPDIISEKIFGIYEKNEEFGEKFVAIEQSVEKIDQTVGTIKEEQNSVKQEVSRLEQTSGRIEASVSKVEKNFNDNLEITALREGLNKSIIDLISSLGIFKSYLGEQVKIPKIEQSVKTEIQVQLGVINDRREKVLLYTDKVLGIMEQKGYTDKFNSLNSSKTKFINALNNLATILNSIISDNVFVPSEITMITDIFGKAVIATNQLKNSCDDCIQLGTGGSTSEELARLNMQSDKIILSVSKVEKNISNSLGVEQSQIQTQVNDTLTSFYNLQSSLSDIFKDGKVTEAEKVVINEGYASLTKEKADLDNLYNSYYNNELISVATKNQLKETYTEYCNKHSGIKDVVDRVCSDGFVNEIEISEVSTLLTSYEVALNQLHRKMTDSVKDISENRTVKLIENAKKSLQGEIGEVNSAVDSLENTMNGSFKDGVLSDSEKLAIKQNLQVLLNEKTDIDKQFETLYGNKDLEGEPKTNLKKAYDSYLSKYLTLVETINTIVSKQGEVDESDKTSLDNAFAEHRASLGNYSVSVGHVIDAIAYKKASTQANIVDKKWSDIVLDPEAGIKASVGKLNEKVTQNINTVNGVKEEVKTVKSDIGELTVKNNSISSKVESLEQTEIKNRKVANFRYVRDYLNGSTVNGGNHWVELEVWVGGANIARGLTPTSDCRVIKPLTNATDGSINTNVYAEVDNTGWGYLQIDLGSIRDVDMVKTWHYYGDNRAYNHRLEVSRDGQTWYELFNSEKSGRYIETNLGRTYILNEANTISRLEVAEQKIQPDAIINTVKSSKTNGKNTFVQGSELTQTINEFNFKFEKNGSENAIKNAWFLGGLTHWEAVQWDNGDTSNRNISISHTVGNKVDNWLPLGVNFIKVSNSGSIGNRHWGGIQQVVQVEAGEKYTLSYYVAGHRIGRNVIEIKRGDSGEWLNSTTIDNIKPSKERGSKLDEDFTFVKYTFTAPSDCSSIRICLWAEGRLDGGGGSYAWFAKTQLEKGDTATARKLASNEISNNSTTIDEIGVRVNSKNESQFARMDNEFFSVYNGGEAPVNRQAFMGLENGVPTILLGAHGINPGVSVFGGTHFGFKHYAPDRSPLGWGGSWGMLEYKLDSGASDISRLGFSQAGNIELIPHSATHLYKNVHVHGNPNTGQAWEISASMGHFPTYIQQWNTTAQLRGIKVHSHVIGSDNDNNIYFINKSGMFSNLYGTFHTMSTASVAMGLRALKIPKVYRKNVPVTLDIGQTVNELITENKKLKEELRSSLLATIDVYEMILSINPKADPTENVMKAYQTLIKSSDKKIGDLPEQVRLKYRTYLG